MNVDQAIEGVLAREGGYSNHAADRGGATMYGITEAVARQNGYTGPMQALPRELAKRIYLNRYWHAPGFSRIADLSPRIAEEAMDTGINMGPAVAGAFLQRALNAFSQAGQLYPMVAVDGACGPATMAALQGYMARRAAQNGEVVMLRALNALQAVRYIEITESRPANSAFTFGWFANRVVI